MKSADTPVLPPTCRHTNWRACGGTKYNAATASVLAFHLAGDLTPFRTDNGLVAPGSKLFLKVFVMLTTGNEKGSRTVSVTRP